MTESTLSTDQRAAVFDAVVRTLKKTNPKLFEHGHETHAGGLADLDSHLDGLIAIVQRTTAHTIEPYLVQILEEICSTCPYQYASGFCSLRQQGLCLLYTHAGLIVEAIAGALAEQRSRA